MALARRAFVAYAEHFYCTDPRLGPHASPAALVMPGGTNFETMREAGQVLAGSPATVRDALRRYLAAVGPRHNYLCGAFQWGDLTTEEARRSLDLFAAEVKPALQLKEQCHGEYRSGLPGQRRARRWTSIARSTSASRTNWDPARLIEQLVVPIRSGRAWRVPAGHVFRIVTIDGPQVGDLNIWNAHNPRERMWASRSRQLQAAHVSTFDRLWSNLPYLRPLVTITADTLAGYGVDEVGGRVHDLLGTRCDPYVNRLLMGVDFDFHCHSNLVRAVAPHGLTEFDVHDVLNVFQVTGLNSDDQVLHARVSGEAGRLPGVLRRDRSAVRHLGVSRRRSVGAAMGTGCARSDRRVSAVGGGGVRGGQSTAGWLEAAGGGCVRRRARDASSKDRFGRGRAVSG